MKRDQCYWGEKELAVTDFLMIEARGYESKFSPQSRTGNKKTRPQSPEIPAKHNAVEMNLTFPHIIVFDTCSGFS